MIYKPFENLYHHWKSKDVRTYESFDYISQNLSQIISSLELSSASIFYGTNAQRLRLSATDNSIFVEIDTGNIYQGQIVAPGSINWVLINVNEYVQIADSNAGLVLTTTPTDISGATITLTRLGTHIISAAFDFDTSGAGDANVTLTGRLVTNATPQGQTVNFRSTNSRAVCSRQWKYYAAYINQVVKLQGYKSGGTGASLIATPGTNICAQWITSANI